MHGNDFPTYYTTIYYFFLILFPALDGNIINGHRTESIDKCTHARRAFVINGTFRSIAARRILYPLSSSPAVRFFGILTTMSISYYEAFPMPADVLLHSASRQAYFQCRSQQRFYEYRRLQRVCIPCLPTYGLHPSYQPFCFIVPVESRMFFFSEYGSRQTAWLSVRHRKCHFRYSRPHLWKPYPLPIQGQLSANG